MLNQMAVTYDAAGSPLMIPDPNLLYDGESIIKDETWKTIAAKLASSLGETPKASRSAREQVSDMIQ